MRERKREESVYICVCVCERERECVCVREGCPVMLKPIPSSRKFPKFFHMFLIVTAVLYCPGPSPSPSPGPSPRAYTTWESMWHCWPCMV